MCWFGRSFALAVACAAAGPAFAASDTLTFTGLVPSSCAITVAGAGTLDLASGGTVLTSTSGLGMPATATLLATGGTFRVSVTPPSGFLVAPTGAGTGVTFETRYTAGGVTSASNLVGTVQTLLGIGLTTLSVNLTATKPTVFPAGPYTAQATVTCE